MTLEKKLKDKYNVEYKKVFDKDFQQSIKRADQSRKIFSKTNISSLAVKFLMINGQR